MSAYDLHGALAGSSLRAAASDEFRAAALWQGAASDRLLGYARYFPHDPNQAWRWDSRALSARAAEMVANDAHLLSMLATVVSGILGPAGLRWKSLAQVDDQPVADLTERNLRRQLEAEVERASAGRRLDAASEQSLRALDEQLLHDCIIYGDAFLVRVWRPERPDAYTGCAWRMVEPARVKTPPDELLRRHGDDPARTYEGIVLDDVGTRLALWVERSPAPGRPAAVESSADADRWTRVPWRAPDGTLNVLHLYRKTFSQQIRGVSWYAPIMALSVYLMGATEAYAVGKRGQAARQTWIKVQDPKTASRMEAAGATFGPFTVETPGQIGYLGPGCDVMMPAIPFQGQDFSAYVDVIVRALSACWELPYQVVLKQLTNANLASSRAALDQVEQTNERNRGWFVDRVAGPRVEVILREAVAWGRIPPPPAGDWMLWRAGRFIGGRRPRTDIGREASAIATMIHEVGVSETTAFAEMGWDWEDEQLRRADELAFRSELGLPLTQPAPAPVARPGDGPEAEPTPVPTGQEDVQ